MISVHDVLKKKIEFVRLASDLADIKDIRIILSLRTEEKQLTSKTLEKVKGGTDLYKKIQVFVNAYKEFKIPTL